VKNHLIRPTQEAVGMRDFIWTLWPHRDPKSLWVAHISAPPIGVLMCVKFLLLFFNDLTLCV
jgi:hypothetical protein